MAGKEGTKKAGRRKPGKLTYFYLNGNLHKSLYINRGADQITTWCYPLHKRVAYTYSDVKKHREFAYSTKEVCKMLNRGRVTIETAIMRGDIPEPQYTYGLNEHKKKYKYMWSEKDILAAHDYLLTVHRGRPRHDGVIIPALLPSRKELRAMIRQEEMLYIRDDDGEFRPVWRAQNFD